VAARTDAKAAAGAHEAGATAFMTMPFALAELLACLRFRPLLASAPCVTDASTILIQRER
jgi:hypothetical protein